MNRRIIRQILFARIHPVNRIPRDVPESSETAGKMSGKIGKWIRAATF
jgi:hypothetical protein